jgi:protein-S-isoprenylcysteine O-methyltransferase Ste14
MGRFVAFLYGLAAYLVFLPTFSYAVGFLGGFIVPKNIDSGPAVPFAEAMVVNIALMSLFALQHSVMARPQFKRWWTKVVPEAVERSTYVLFTSVALILLFWQWRPMPTIVWHISNPDLAMAVSGVFGFGWLLVLLSTFMINHFHLFGLEQATWVLAGRKVGKPVFETPMLYRYVRHPIYLGFMIAFWAAPTMTLGHLLFAGVTTAYIFIGIAFEERDLIEAFGDEYRHYREKVAMLVPFWPK